MSYDLRLAVKVEGAEDLYAVVSCPEYSQPTYNLREMFVACMDWDYEQGKWYKVSEVLPKIERGIHELSLYPGRYKKYNAENGWGTVRSALEALESLLKDIRDEVTGWNSWNEIPPDLLYMSW